MRLFTRATNSSRLERWLGTESVEHLSQSVRGWYGPPIAVAGVPGSVWACGDGDFRGPIACGQYSHALDFAQQRLKRVFRDVSRAQSRTLNMGFSSLPDLISEASNGKRLIFPFSKAPGNLPHEIAGNCVSLWRSGTQPAAAGAPITLPPDGNALDSSSAGSFKFTNPTSPETQHFLGGYPVMSSDSNTLLIYDRLFHVAKTMNDTTAEPMTGVPTRYQSQTSTDADYIGGNFLFMEINGQLPGGGVNHNWTVCTYTDQDGNASTLPSVVISNSNDQEAMILDMPLRTWFAPLAGGDVGVKALTQMQCSVAIATGSITFAIGHPIAFMPCPIANVVCQADGINSAFNLVRILDNACLAILALNRPGTTTTTYIGRFETVSG